MKLLRNTLPIAAAACLAACNLPVTPWVSFVPYGNPQFDPDAFKTVFNNWAAGQNVTWQIRFKGGTFAAQEVTVASTGMLTLIGASGQASRSFTPKKTEITRMLDRVVSSGVFTLYDGRYAAFLQGGGSGGPELNITANELVKHVSKDDNLSSGLSHEAGAIEAAANAVADLALPYLTGTAK